MQEHRFENLIALCPNCHRRADAGEIDRLSLLQYKARLAAAFRFEDSHVYPDEQASPPTFSWVDAGARWRTLVLRRQDLTRKFEAELEYPEFSLGTSAERSLNQLVHEQAAQALEDFASQAVYSKEAEQFPSVPGYQFNSSFAVSLLAGDFVSVRFSYFGFSGGAHGFHYTRVANAHLHPFQSLEFSDLFVDPQGAQDKVSAFAIRALLDPADERHPRSEDWIRQGAGPDPRNFRTFNLTPQGLLLTFDEYQVGAYVEQTSEVLMPWASLYSLMTDRIRRLV